MKSNFKVKIDLYVIAKVDDIDYYYFENLANEGMIKFILFYCVAMLPYLF